MAEKEITKKYSNGEITVVWKPSLCIHSGICSRGLPLVFDARKRPWIDINASDTEHIINQVKKCPSGALSYYENAEEDAASLQIDAETKLEVTPNGPLLVYGNVTIKDARGHKIKKNNVTAFCRCGQSGNKPFCDGSHITTNFRDGHENAH
jgi:uncharacterized Fe-S cluster protein YjdI/CDGSH-type Zn-finger protein